MKAKLRENAPWETQKLKTGIILNKKEFTTIKDETVKLFIKNSLSKTVEIEGETPIVVPKRKLKTEIPVVKKRVLKATTKKEIKKKAITTKKVKPKVIIDEDSLTEVSLKKLLKQDILELLLKRGFSKKELKGLKKDRLIEVYLIDKL